MAAMYHSGRTYSAIQPNGEDEKYSNKRMDWYQVFPLVN